MEAYAQLAIQPCTHTQKSTVVLIVCMPTLKDTQECIDPPICVVKHAYLYGCTSKRSLSIFFGTDTTRGNPRKTSLTRACSSRSKAGETLDMAAVWGSSAMALYGHGGRGHVVDVVEMHQGMDLPRRKRCNAGWVNVQDTLMEWHPHKISIELYVILFDTLLQPNFTSIAP